jgi:hypothetical protein
MSRVCEALAQSAFGGSTFEPKRDGARLGQQLERVRNLMADNQWRTLAEIGEAVGSPEASVSARLRDLRGQGLTVDREFVRRGLWRYRVLGVVGGVTAGATFLKALPE